MHTQSTYHKVWTGRQLLAGRQFSHAQLGHHVIIRGLISNAPPHVYHLEIIAPLLAERFQFGINLFHQSVAFNRGICQGNNRSIRQNAMILKYSVTVV